MYIQFYRSISNVDDEDDDDGGGDGGGVSVYTVEYMLFIHIIVLYEIYYGENGLADKSEHLECAFCKTLRVCVCRHEYYYYDY